MNSTRSVVGAVVVRAAALVLAAVGSAFGYRALGLGPGDASADADFGGGWAVLGTVVLVAAVWGAWDGWHRRLGTVALTWLVTGLVVGAVALARADWGAPRHVVLTDLPIVPTMITVFVLLPALAVGGMAASVRSSAHPG